MFLGSYTPKLDDKGRLILPAKFREQLAPGLVLARGQERCVFVYPMAEFQRITDLINASPITEGGARHFIRMLMSSAHDQQPDKQGRITIPALLRRYASLDRDVVVVGLGSRAEIWDLPTWERYEAEQEPAFAEVAKGIPGLF